MVSLFVQFAVSLGNCNKSFLDAMLESTNKNVYYWDHAGRNCLHCTIQLSRNFMTINSRPLLSAYHK